MNPTYLTIITVRKYYFIILPEGRRRRVRVPREQQVVRRHEELQDRLRHRLRVVVLYIRTVPIDIIFQYFNERKYTLHIHIEILHKIYLIECEQHLLKYEAMTEDLALFQTNQQKIKLKNFSALIQHFKTSAFQSHPFIAHSHKTTI